MQNGQPDVHGHGFPHASAFLWVARLFVFVWGLKGKPKGKQPFWRGPYKRQTHMVHDLQVIFFLPAAVNVPVGALGAAVRAVYCARLRPGREVPRQPCGSLPSPVKRLCIQD